MTPKCHNQYYDEFLRTKLLPERSICLEKVSKNLSALHDRLVDNRWRCFALDPCRAHQQWVREFYANLSIVSFKNPVIRIWGGMCNLRWNKSMIYMGSQM